MSAADVKMGSRRIGTGCVVLWGCVLLLCRPLRRPGPLPADRMLLLSPSCLRRRGTVTDCPPKTSKNPDCRY